MRSCFVLSGSLAVFSFLASRGEGFRLSLRGLTAAWGVPDAVGSGRARVQRPGKMGAVEFELEHPDAGRMNGAVGDETEDVLL